MRKTELQNEKKQFGIYGFFIIFSAYIFKLFILRATENMYFSYTLSSFADLGMQTAEIISNFIITAFIVKFLVKSELLCSGIFKKFIINFLIPAYILLFIENFIDEIFYEAAKYEFWIYFVTTLSAVAKFLKGFIWVSGIFIFISKKTFTLFDFFKKLRERISLIVAVPLIVFLSLINPLIFDLKTLRSVLYNDIFEKMGSFSEGIIYFITVSASIYTILEIFLFFINMLTKSSDEIINCKNSCDVFLTAKFIKSNMPFFILKIVAPQAVLIYMYNFFSNISQNSSGMTEIFAEIFPIILIVLVETFVVKSIFSLLKIKIKHSSATPLWYGLVSVFVVGNFFQKIFITFFGTPENIFSTSLYLLFLLWSAGIYAIFIICMSWVSESPRKINILLPFTFMYSVNPLKTSLTALAGFTVFLSQYTAAENFDRVMQIGILSNLSFLLILFSAVITGSAFLFYLVYKFTKKI